MTALGKVSGAWKDISQIQTKVSGSWKEVTEGYIKQSGAWNQFFSLAPSGSFDLLATQTLSNNTTTEIEFTSGGVWADYQHLQLRVVATQYYSSGSTLGSNVKIQLNGSSTTYRGHFLRGNGSVVGSGEYTNQAAWNRIPVSSSTSQNEFGAFVVDILDINNSNKNTTMRGIGGATQGFHWIELASGAWFSTAALTSLKVIANEQALGNKSRFSLYGIRSS